MELPGPVSWSIGYESAGCGWSTDLAERGRGEAAEWVVDPFGVVIDVVLDAPVFGKYSSFEQGVELVAMRSSPRKQPLNDSL